QECVRNILLGGRHLLRIINDILDLSKVEAGHMELSPEPTALPEVAEQVLELLRPLAHPKEVGLTVSIPTGLPPLFADPVRLKQILYNLLSNGIKFTPRGGAVRLEARATRAGVEIAVQDSGVGIRAEDLPRLFHEFEQLEATRRPGAQGTGLGLVLTKRLV